MESARFAVHPFDSPLRLFSNNIDRRNSREKIIFLLGIFDVGIDKQRVCLGVNILHGHLEAIEASCFRNLNLTAKLLAKIFKNDAVWSCEECQHVFDEVFFFGIQFLPVLEILIEIDLVGSPEGSEMFFVHFIDGGIVDWEQDETLRVLGQERFFLLGHSEGIRHSNSKYYVSCSN